MVKQEISSFGDITSLKREERRVDMKDVPEAFGDSYRKVDTGMINQFEQTQPTYVIK
jgi:hypothetical protein